MISDLPALSLMCWKLFRLLPRQHRNYLFEECDHIAMSCRALILFEINSATHNSKGKGTFCSLGAINKKNIFPTVVTIRLLLEKILCSCSAMKICTEANTWDTDWRYRMKCGTWHAGMSEGTCTEMLKIHGEFLASGKFCHLFLSQRCMCSESSLKNKDNNKCSTLPP